MSAGDPSSLGDIQMLEERGKGTFWEYLGCKALAVSEHEALAELEVHAHHLNVIGLLHGGVYASLLDSIMGLLAMTARPGAAVVTSTLNLHFTAPVAAGRVRAAAKFLHASKRTLTIAGRVTDEADRLCAYATGTFRVVSANAADSAT